MAGEFSNGPVAEDYRSVPDEVGAVGRVRTEQGRESLDAIVKER